MQSVPRKQSIIAWQEDFSSDPTRPVIYEQKFTACQANSEYLVLIRLGLNACYSGSVLDQSKTRLDLIFRAQSKPYIHSLCLCTVGWGFFWRWPLKWSVRVEEAFHEHTDIWNNNLWGKNDWLHLGTKCSSCWYARQMVQPKILCLVDLTLLFWYLICYKGRNINCRHRNLQKLKAQIYQMTHFSFT